MLHTATSCEETRFPWPRFAPPDERARRTQAHATAALLPDEAFDPFDRATAVDNDLIELCGRWPAAVAAPNFGSGPLPDVPVLLMAGQDDLRTPVENARRVADQFPRSRLLVAPETGHGALGDPSGCTNAAFSRFMQGRGITTSCPHGPRLFPATPLPPTRLGRVRPLAGVGGARGRVLGAVALTLRDVGDDALSALVMGPEDPDLARGGGLRAGSYRIDVAAALRLRGLVFVPGVRLTGRVISFFRSRRRRGRIRVQGAPGVPSGVVRIRGEVMRGTLGGRRVRARLELSPNAAKVRATATRLAGGAGRRRGGRACGRASAGRCASRVRGQSYASVRPASPACASTSRAKRSKSRA
jgi:hypothetical protein